MDPIPSLCLLRPNRIALQTFVKWQKRHIDLLAQHLKFSRKSAVSRVNVLHARPRRAQHSSRPHLLGSHQDRLCVRERGGGADTSLAILEDVVVRAEREHQAALEVLVAFEAGVDFAFPAVQDVGAGVPPDSEIVAGGVETVVCSKVVAETAWEAKGGVVAGARGEGVAEEADADVWTGD